MSRIPNLLIRRSPSTSSAVPTQVRRSKKKGGEDANVKGYSMNVFTHISNHLPDMIARNPQLDTRTFTYTCSQSITAPSAQNNLLS